MKSYNQFVSEAYSAREDLNEVIGVAAKLLGRLGGKGFRAGKTFAKYAGRKGLGAGMAGFALAKGDPIGTGLGLASMAPGPVGLLATGANLLRGVRGDHRNSQKKVDAPKETKPETKVEVKSNKTLDDMRKEIDDTQKKIDKAYQDGTIKNPFK